MSRNCNLTDKIIQICNIEGLSVMEAVIFYAEERHMKFEAVVKLLPEVLVNAIKAEAIRKNLIK